MPVGQRMPTVGNVKTAWIPLASWTTTFPALTAVIAAAGTDLTHYEISDSKVGLGASDTINEKAIGDLANTDVPTYAKYDGCSLHLFRSIGAASSVPGTDDLLTVFAGRPFGYYIRRVGKLNTVAFTATDVVEAYLFQADSVAIEANDGGNVKMMVPLLQQGVYNLNIALT